jgi:predicted transcriptional regulator
VCKLNDLEIKVLKYHKQKGCDYSKSLAKALNIKLCEAFVVHKKLLSLGYLEKPGFPA